MYRGAGYVFWILPGAALWFIVVWFTHIHSFEWRKAIVWFVIGRLIGLFTLTIAGANGLHVSRAAELLFMILTTVLTISAFVAWEFRDLRTLIKLKIILTWLILDSLFGLLGLYMVVYPGFQYD